MTLYIFQNWSSGVFRSSFLLSSSISPKRLRERLKNIPKGTGQLSNYSKNNSNQNRLRKESAFRIFKMIKINFKRPDADDTMDADDEAVPFEESDFGVEESNEECRKSECVRVKEEYDRIVVETIRNIRVFLCFYCEFEDSDKGDMRRHFEATHNVKREHVEQSKC